MEPQLIADYQCVTGEGPLWHPLERRIYWLDIPQGRMFRYSPDTGEHEMCYEGEQVGGFTIQADGALLLFGERCSVRLWRDGELETVIAEIPEERNTRFNDVIADPEGRVYCGTMPAPDHPARLYRLDPDGSLTIAVDNVGLSNGLGFTPDRRQVYYTDTLRRVIQRYDYDQASGALTNAQVFVRVPEDASEGMPDGMTVDAQGDVWSARWDGGCLVRYGPDGSEKQRLAFPAKKVSCVIFGGDDYTDMYVTTAGGQDKAAEGDGAGALFRLNLGIRGLPEFTSRIGL